MKTAILKYLQASTNNLTVEQVVLGFVAATIIGGIIYLSYRFSHSSAVYSARFNVSLIMLTLVTTLIMSVIGNNVALSLGMVGALSIVRYRTAIKDPRDTAYIFWAIAAGICCGVQDFMVVGIGSGAIFIVMLIVGNTKNNDRYLIIVRGKTECIDEARELVDRYFYENVKLRVENTTKETVELIYEASEKSLEHAKYKNGCMPADVLYKVEGVESVNIVCQNDEINR